MRRAIPAALTVLLLGGCSGFGHFIHDSTTMAPNPNAPAASGMTASRALGHTATVKPLVPQSGDVWPAAVPSEPTLSDYVNQMNQSTLPGTAPTAPSAPGAAMQTPAAPATGTVVNTSRGPATTTGGSVHYQTLSGPNGQTGSILIPNGNGTSTLIRADGSVETMPTPKK